MRCDCEGLSRLSSRHRVVPIWFFVGMDWDMFWGLISDSNRVASFFISHNKVRM